MSDWEALSATDAFYSAICIVLYTHRCGRLDCLTASMRCFVSHSLHVTLKWAVPVINRLPHNQRCSCQLDRNSDQQFSTTVVGNCWFNNIRPHWSRGVTWPRLLSGDLSTLAYRPRPLARRLCESSSLSLVTQRGVFDDTVVYSTAGGLEVGEVANPSKC